MKKKEEERSKDLSRMEDGTPATTVTRRNFLKSTGSAAALAGIAASGLVLSAKDAKASTLPKKWDEKVDVAVIGSGFAGLAAAIEAKNAGSSVVVLEKMRVAGGNSRINGGAIAAAGSPLQAKEGIKDSPDLLYKDMMKAGLGLNYPELARTVAEQSNEAVQWTINSLGVKYEDRLIPLGGHSVIRSYRTPTKSGSGIIMPMLAKLKKLGVKIRKSTYLKEIIRDKNGRVRGVKIREGYRFPKDNSGKVKYIETKKAVIMATGGFGMDFAFRTVQDPRLTKDVDSTNQPGATADGLKAALRVGATPVQLSWIQLGPWTSPDEKGFGMGVWFNIMAACPSGIWVDPDTGKRFVNELADRKTRADATLKTGHPCISIADQQAVRKVGKLDKMLEKGLVKKFNTLEDLASAYKIPFKSLQKTVKEYNAYVKEGEDKAFGKPLRKGSGPVAQAPFYAMRSWPKVHHCMGGVQINTKAQVIGLNNKPVKGLYAAGEAAGGVHGACRLGSCATADCIIFGRIAGKNAAAS